ncbi:nucleotide phosphatase [Lithospermum erythrorhizon]|uniref:Nucleotide phosphatase n=1 Tax=Lithospermum erythrorhizon TaxID=34254 RepID=A0AAV3NSS0_LITER
MLVYWIPETYNTLHINATHRVQIGAIVMNDKKDLLVVQEKMGRFHGTGFWKMATGTLDEGEDVFRGAMREVKEETGVRTNLTVLMQPMNLQVFLHGIIKFGKA